MTTTQPQKFATTITTLRAEYLRELEQLGEQLRPRFVSGELHGFRTSDDGAGEKRLCEAVEEYFGLQVTRQETPAWLLLTANDAVAHAILAVSPFADVTAEAGFDHVAYQAAEAAAWDLITLARGRGWYAPPAGDDEVPHPGHLDDGSCSGCSAAA